VQYRTDCWNVKGLRQTYLTVILLTTVTVFSSDYTFLVRFEVLTEVLLKT